MQAFMSTISLHELHINIIAYYTKQIILWAFMLATLLLLKEGPELKSHGVGHFF